MQLMDELKAWLSLARVPGIHARTLEPWLQQLGSVASLLQNSSGALRSAGLSAQNIEALSAAAPQVESDLRWLRHCGFAALDIPTLDGGLSK